MNSQDLRRYYLAKQARNAPPDPPRRCFIITSDASEELMTEWRRLRRKLGPEEAARQVGIKGQWEMV